MLFESSMTYSDLAVSRKSTLSLDGHQLEADTPQVLFRSFASNGYLTLSLANIDGDNILIIHLEGSSTSLFCKDE